jgi:hypothetical protein
MENDELLPYFGKICRVMTQNHELPLFGKLVGLSAQFATFERKDGRRALVNRRSIQTIEATWRQEEAPSRAQPQQPQEVS